VSGLVLDDVRVTKNRVEILHPVSAVLPRGRLIVVAGPNGAGKSTLLRCLAGIEPDGQGRVALDGVELGALTAAARAKLVAWVPPPAPIPFDFDVRSVVAMGRFPWRGGGDENGRERVETALAAMRLAPLSARSVRTLSSGERQKVFIARALASDAPVLLFDEPCAALDLAAALAVLSLFRQLAAAGRLVVVTLHDLALATRFADYTLLLAGGHLVAAGERVLTREAIERVFAVKAESVTAPSGVATWIFHPLV
jgi:iron complex transport system ATP-binding protein